METRPAISVILPVYNARQYVEQTIRSVLVQSFTDFELIVVDDGSSDGSGEICQRLAAEDSRIRLFHHENHGICYSRNFALREAKGNYVAFCDHDDLYEKNYLELLYSAAIENNAYLVKGQYRGVIESNGKVITDSKMEYLDGNVSEEKLLEKYQFFLRTINVLWNGLYVRQIIAKNGIEFDESFKAGWEDNLFNLKYLTACENIYGVNKLIYTHIRRTGQSASLGYNPERIIGLRKVYNSESEYLAQNKELISGQFFIAHQNRFLTALKTELWYSDSPLSLREKEKYIANFVRNRVNFVHPTFKDICHAFKDNPKATVKWMMFQLRMAWLLCLYWELSKE